MHFSKISLVKLSVLTALTISSSALFAQPSQGSGPGQPPAEALEACKSLTSGQDCSFTGQRGTEKGTCWAPEGKPLACKSANAPSPNGQGKK